MCGNTPSSSPVRNTTGNSRPLAVCSVISVTTPLVVLTVRDLVGVGDQRDPLQEAVQSGALGVHRRRFELARDGDQLPQVLHPSLVLRVIRRCQLGQVAGALQHRLEDRRRPLTVGDQRAELVDQRHERLDRRQRPRCDPRRIRCPAQRLPEGDPLPLGERLDAGLGTVADARAAAR